jgi:hypothetical protein
MSLKSPIRSASDIPATASGPLTAGGHAGGASSGGDRADFVLAGVIGSQLSEPVDVLQRIVTEFTRTRKISRGQMQQMLSAIEEAHKVAMQSQQIARLSGGRLRQSHERLSLNEMLHQSLDERAQDFQQRGMEVYRNIRSVDVIVDPGLLSSLLDAATDWAASMGQKLVVSLEMKNWPEHGMIVFKASQTVAMGNVDITHAGDNLSWHLVVQTAKVMGLAVDRVHSATDSVLMLEFPRTVRQLEGLTAVEVDGGADSTFMHTESKPLAGHRVLLITGDDNLKGDVKLICRNMGLIMDSVPTTGQGVRFCELDRPHMLIIDERIRDEKFDELRQDLLRTDPNFPFLWPLPAGWATA